MGQDQNEGVFKEDLTTGARNLTEGVLKCSFKLPNIIHTEWSRFINFQKVRATSSSGPPYSSLTGLSNRLPAFQRQIRTTKDGTCSSQYVSRIFRVAGSYSRSDGPRMMQKKKKDQV